MTTPPVLPPRRPLTAAALLAAVTDRPSMLASVALALGLLAGCVTEPTPPALTGQYGGRLLEVVAWDTAAHFVFACSYARTGPVRPDEHGVAEARGWSHVREPGDGPLLGYRVVVRQRADSLTVFSTFNLDSYVWTDSHSVRRGVPADFSGMACP